MILPVSRPGTLRWSGSEEMTALSITVLLLLVALSAYFSPWGWRKLRMAVIRKKLSEDRVLILTYDDGPSETLTPRLLDLLKQHGAKASFFMLGRNAAKYPHIVERVMQEGHDIGCHSDQHVHAWKASPWSAVSDINAGYSRLARWVAPDGMFRPPYGKMTLPTLLSVLRRGAPVWWWTLDSGDTHDILPRTEEVKDALLRDHGGIVLMHDMERPLDRDEFVLQTTATLLETAGKQSMRVIPLRNLQS
jgi:peptidoglycan-N-acetylglucosamine deacetylase